jgi:hypothetical protein
MNPRRRLAAGAAIAGALVTPAAALAASTPTPAGSPNEPTPAWPVTSVPLPEGLAQCLIQNGLPATLAGTKVDLPGIAGAPPTSLAGTLPLPGVHVPTVSDAVPLSAAGVPPTDSGTNPLPTGGGATSTGGDQCGQIIINNTAYIVLVTVTTTTTTTNANGPMTAANGPVTNDLGPAPAPVTPTATPAPAAPVPTARPRHRRKHRSPVRKHSAHTRARPGTRALRILLFRRGRGDGSRRVTTLAAHAGRGS